MRSAQKDSGARSTAGNVAASGGSDGRKGAKKGVSAATGSAPRRNRRATASPALMQQMSQRGVGVKSISSLGAISRKGSYGAGHRERSVPHRRSPQKKTACFPKSASADDAAPLAKVEVGQGDQTHHREEERHEGKCLSAPIMAETSELCRMGLHCSAENPAVVVMPSVLDDARDDDVVDCEDIVAALRLCFEHVSLPGGMAVAADVVHMARADSWLSGRLSRPARPFAPGGGESLEDVLRNVEYHPSRGGNQEISWPSLRRYFTRGGGHGSTEACPGGSVKEDGDVFEKGVVVSAPDPLACGTSAAVLALRGWLTLHFGGAQSAADRLLQLQEESSGIDPAAAAFLPANGPCGRRECRRDGAAAVSLVALAELLLGTDGAAAVTDGTLDEVFKHLDPTGVGTVGIDELLGLEAGCGRTGAFNSRAVEGELNADDTEFASEGSQCKRQCEKLRHNEDGQEWEQPTQHVQVEYQSPQDALSNVTDEGLVEGEELPQQRQQWRQKKLHDIQPWAGQQEEQLGRDKEDVGQGDIDPEHWALLRRVFDQLAGQMASDTVDTEQLLLQIRSDLRARRGFALHRTLHLRNDSSLYAGSLDSRPVTLGQALEYVEVRLRGGRATWPQLEASVREASQGRRPRLSDLIVAAREVGNDDDASLVVAAAARPPAPGAGGGRGGGGGGGREPSPPHTMTEEGDEKEVAGLDVPKDEEGAIKWMTDSLGVDGVALRWVHSIFAQCKASSSQGSPPLSPPPLRISSHLDRGRCGQRRWPPPGAGGGSAVGREELLGALQGCPESVAMLMTRQVCLPSSSARATPKKQVWADVVTDLAGLACEELTWVDVLEVVQWHHGLCLGTSAGRVQRRQDPSTVPRGALSFMRAAESSVPAGAVARHPFLDHSSCSSSASEG